MSAPQLLADLRQRGVRVRVLGDRLRIDGPAGSLPTEFVEQVRRHKEAVTAELARERWAADPRPDLGDSPLWTRLLPLAYARDGADPNGLFGALHGLRCCGARLIVDDGRLRLTRGEMDPAEYAADRARYLVPHSDALRALLVSAAPGPEE